MRCAWVVAWILTLLPGFGRSESLAEALRAHLDQDLFRSATWGVKVVVAATGATLFEQNAEKLLKPASNAKLFTAALALDRLGPEARVRTSFYAGRPLSRRGTLRGDLVVYGRGDPSFSARFNDGDWRRSLDPLVDALEAAGIRRVRGDLVGDPSYFRGPPLGAGWAWEDLQFYYGAAASALTVDDNVIDLVLKPGERVGDRCRLLLMTDADVAAHASWIDLHNATTTGGEDGERRVVVRRGVGEDAVEIHGQLPLGSEPWLDAVAVPDPERWFLVRLREAMAARGIRVSGETRVDVKAGEKGVEVAYAESRPVEELVEKMLKPSQNLYAQLLFLQVGESRRAAGEPDETSEELGVREMRRFVEEFGIDPNEVLLEEGSGLSRRSLLTPNAIVKLLVRMNGHPAREAFRSALPVAGVDGSLRRRLEGAATRGNVRAKTGTLRYVNALSGYVATESGQELVFAILLNGFGDASARQQIDRVVELLAGWRGAE